LAVNPLGGIPAWRYPCMAVSPHGGQSPINLLLTGLFQPMTNASMVTCVIVVRHCGTPRTLVYGYLVTRFEGVPRGLTPCTQFRFEALCLELVPNLVRRSQTTCPAIPLRLAQR